MEESPFREPVLDAKSEVTCQVSDRPTLSQLPACGPRLSSWVHTRGCIFPLDLR
ncbi:hypothetical protein STEG23_016943, partial [Scotinomys teguina]